MEQRIDSQTKTEFAAGTDPAYIPGLTAPAPARTGEDADVADAVPEDYRGTGDPEVPVVGAPGSAAPADAVPALGSAAPDEDGTAPADGPAFEVSDRRGSIRVDAAGVRFVLDDQEAEFDWSEIGAVEVRTGRFGRRFTVTVHLSTRRWFNAEVEADARGRLKQWTAELDAVLDAYFEEA